MSGRNKVLNVATNGFLMLQKMGFNDTKNKFFKCRKEIGFLMSQKMDILCCQKDRFFNFATNKFSMSQK